MSIARVVDHLYVIEKKEDRVKIFFLTSRRYWFIPALVWIGLSFAPVWAGFHFGLNGNVMSGL